uniref:Somatostatin/Cortistatin C-terminal domain-containing protein n=1 Tax=Fundulus heteroclitus TaxID=8078 RepID=A0A3Q2Q5F7_FUNHE
MYFLTIKGVISPKYSDMSVLGASSFKNMSLTPFHGSVLLQDLTDLLLLRFMSELMASGGEELHHELEEDEFGGGRERLTRRHIRFAHRARKAGCRNFFWKSFTSC